MFLMSFGDDDAYITYMLQQQKPAGSQIPFSLLWEKRANDAVKTFNVNITSSASYSWCFKKSAVLTKHEGWCNEKIFIYWNTKKAKNPPTDSCAKKSPPSPPLKFPSSGREKWRSERLPFFVRRFSLCLSPCNTQEALSNQIGSQWKSSPISKGISRDAGNWLRNGGWMGRCNNERYEVYNFFPRAVHAFPPPP